MRRARLSLLDRVGEQHSSHGQHTLVRTKSTNSVWLAGGAPRLAAALISQTAAKIATIPAITAPSRSHWNINASRASRRCGKVPGSATASYAKRTAGHCVMCASLSDPTPQNTHCSLTVSPPAAATRAVVMGAFKCSFKRNHRCPCGIDLGRHATPRNNICPSHPLALMRSFKYCCHRGNPIATKSRYMVLKTFTFRPRLLCASSKHAW